MKEAEGSHYKERVLALLRDSKGTVSGQDISRTLGKSRAAVWQWIEELRGDGYEIDASPRRGYTLVGVPDRLYPWEIAMHLRTEVVGKAIEYRESVGSTNDVAKALAKDGAPEGLVVVAEEQVAGKGRRGRSWSSPLRQGVWSSTILRPELSPYEAPKMALVAALATVLAIEDVTPLQAAVKWPNDVLVAGKKVCGILVEMDAEIDQVRYLVVGVGINANLPLSAIPDDARPNATSLKAELGRHVERNALLAALLNHLEHLYLGWQSDGFHRILDEIRRRTHTIGRHVRVLEGETAWEGFARAIADDGALVVETHAGVVRPVYAAEVSVRAQ